MVYNSLDDRVFDLFSNLEQFTKIERTKSGTGHDYKKILYEKTFVNSTIKDGRAVIVNNTIFRTSPFMVIDEIMTQYFNYNPPFMSRYRKKEDLAKYYTLSFLERVEYTYGARFNEFNQFEHLISLFKDRLETKRGVISIYTPYDTDPNRVDVPCTLMYNFLVRENKLHAFAAYRSHDLFAGFRIDYVFLSFIIQYLIAILRSELGVNLEVGSISTFDTSLHFYPTEVKSELTRIPSSFTNDKRLFTIFSDTSLTTKDIVEDMIGLKTVEEYAHSGNMFKAYLEFMSLKDPTIRDFARVLLRKNGAMTESLPKMAYEFETTSMWWTNGKF
jgi:thymidylate synthase